MPQKITVEHRLIMFGEQVFGTNNKDAAIARAKKLSKANDTTVFVESWRPTHRVRGGKIEASED